MIRQSTIDFNKELLFGEIGAVVGAQVFSLAASLKFTSAGILSFTSVLGAIIGAALFFLSARIYYKKINKQFSTKKLEEDLLYFTPVAFILTLLVYYPSLYFINKYFLASNIEIILSTFISQASAFFLFLAAINIYRYLLIKLAGKEL